MMKTYTVNAYGRQNRCYWMTWPELVEAMPYLRRNFKVFEVESEDFHRRKWFYGSGA